MCTNKIQISPGVSVVCKKCDECRDQKLLYWTGRCIAESKVSRAAWGLTLTYGGGDTPEAYQLRYDDVQKFFKRLRADGYEFSYIVVGEKGSRRGRAHWHMIIFWHTEPPAYPEPLPDRRVLDWKYWKAGHVVIDAAHAGDGNHMMRLVRYVWKYMTDDGKQGHENEQARFSKKPPIGARYLERWARRHAQQGIPLFPDDAPWFAVEGDRVEKGQRKGQLFRRYMPASSALCRIMIEAFVDEWDQCRPNQPYQGGPVVHEWLAQNRVEDTFDDLKADLEQRENDKLRAKVLRRRYIPHSVKPLPSGLALCEANGGLKYLATISDNGEIEWAGAVAKNQVATAASLPPAPKSVRFKVGRLSGDLLTAYLSAKKGQGQPLG